MRIAGQLVMNYIIHSAVRELAYQSKIDKTVTLLISVHILILTSESKGFIVIVIKT